MGCGEQFSGKDAEFIKNALDSVSVPFGEDIIIKRYVGLADNGDPARGIQPTYQFNKVPSKAIVESVSQRDTLYSGGVYQLGDIKINIKETLNIMDTIEQTGGQSKGDRILWEGHEYRIVGKADSQSVLGTTRLNQYVIRKIGDA